MKTSIALLLCILLVGCQSPNGPFTDPSDKHALAARFVELSGFDQQIEQMRALVEAGIQPAFRRAAELSGKNIPDEMKQELKLITIEEYEELITNSSKDLRKSSIDFYADNLTRDELLEMIEFYERPVFTKFKKLFPEASEIGMQAVQHNLEKTHRRLVERIGVLREQFDNRK